MTRPSVPPDVFPPLPCGCRRVLADHRPPLSAAHRAFLEPRLHAWLTATGGCDPSRATRAVARFAVDGDRLLALRPPSRPGAWNAEFRRMQRQAESRSLPPTTLAKCVVKSAKAAIEDFTTETTLDAWLDYLLVGCEKRWLKEEAPATERDRVSPVPPTAERVSLIRSALELLRQQGKP